MDKGRVMLIDSKSIALTMKSAILIAGVKDAMRKLGIIGR